MPSVNYRTGFTLRGQVTGTNPTTIRVKAWTGSEPAAWQYTSTDSAGPQIAGRAGLRTYASSSTTNAPFTVTVDNYAANADRTLLLRRPPPPSSSAAPPPHRRRLRRLLPRRLLPRRLRAQRPTRSRERVASGWGTADAGGAWAPEAAVADFSVNGTTGRIRLGSGGANRAIFLSPTGVAWDVSASVALDKVPSGGSVWALPRAPPLGEQLHQLPPAGALRQRRHHVRQRVTRRQRQRGAHRQPRRRAVVNYRTGFTLRGQLTGTNPTTIRVKAWTGNEPSTWQFIATDSAGPQVAGRAGLRSYTSAGIANAPLTLTIDDYSASTAVAPPPPPPPTAAATPSASRRRPRVTT